MLTYDIVRDVRCRTYDVVRLHPVYHTYRTYDIVLNIVHTLYVTYDIVGGKNPDAVHTILYCLVPGVQDSRCRTRSFGDVPVPGYPS